MRKNVLMISCEGLGNGGVQAVMMGIVRNLSDEFLFDMLLFTSEKRFYDDEFLSYGGKIHRLPRYEGKNRLRKRVDYYVRGRNVYRNVLKLLKNNSYDIIHCNDEFESAVIAKAAYEAGIENRIVHTHIISEKSNMIAAVINSKRRKQISRYATIRVGCSYESCRSFFSRHDRVFIVNNFYDDRKFYFKERDKEESTIFRILQIGSFSDIKNQMFSLEIINRIRREYPEAVLTFVGYSMDQYENKIYKKIDQYGLKNNVEFYPGDADTLTLLSRTDAFLLPSLYEGFGIVLIEAQAVGVTCYASDMVPGETDCGGVNFLNLQDDAGVWAEKMIYDYKKSGGRHRKYDVSRFSQSNIMNIYKKIYKGEKLEDWNSDISQSN